MEGEFGTGFRMVVTLILIAIVSALLITAFIFSKEPTNKLISEVDTAVASSADAEVLALSDYGNSLPVSTIYATLVQHKDEIGEVNGKLYSFFLEKENDTDVVMEVKMISEYDVTRDGGSVVKSKFLVTDDTFTPISMTDPVVTMGTSDPITDALEQMKESFMGRAKVKIEVRDDNLYKVTLQGVTR